MAIGSDNTFLRSPNGKPPIMDPNANGSQTGAATANNPGNPTNPFDQSRDTAKAAGDAFTASQTPPPNTSSFNRENFRDAWMGSGVRDQASGNAWLQAHPEYAGVSLNGDKLNLPGGEQLDGIMNMKSGNGSPGWTGLMGAGGTPIPHGGSAFGANGQPTGGGYQAGAASSMYAPGQLPPRPANTNYTAGTLPNKQLGSLDNSRFAPTEQMQTEAVQRLLQSGGSMNPEVVNQIKAGQKDSALGMEKGLLQDQAQNFANRGISGGAYDASSRQTLQADMIKNLLNSYRDTDVQAAQTNQADQLNNLGASNTVLAGQESRGVDQLNSQNDATKYALQQALSQEGLRQQEASQALNNYSADTGTYFGGTNDQYKNNALAQSLGIAQMQNSTNLTQAQMANQLGYANLGFNYTNLDSTNRNRALDRALGL